MVICQSLIIYNLKVLVLGMIIDVNGMIRHIITMLGLVFDYLSYYRETRFFINVQY